MIPKQQKFAPLKILDIKEKKKIEKELQERFGIEKIRGFLLMKGQERIFLFSGNMHPREIKTLEDGVIIERVGTYFGKIQNNEVRLSIEGTIALKDQIKKNIFILTETQAEDWLKGRDLDIATGERGFMIMKHGEDFLGCGKASEKKIGNFIPKSRRLKERN